jgi:acyl carrier protein
MTHDPVPTGTPFSAAEARRVVADALLRIVPDADLEALPDDAPVRTELELDSLDFLSFVELLSTGAGVRIDETDYPRLATLSSTTAFLTERAAGA